MNYQEEPTVLVGFAVNAIAVLLVMFAWTSLANQMPVDSVNTNMTTSTSKSLVVKGM
jgi:hypothetical protein